MSLTSPKSHSQKLLDISFTYIDKVPLLFPRVSNGNLEITVSLWLSLTLFSNTSQTRICYSLRISQDLLVTLTVKYSY